VSNELKAHSYNPIEMPTSRQINWAKIRVLAVSAVAITILSILVSLLTGGTMFQPKATIYLYLPDASGLERGSLVRVDGIDIGKVSAVRLSGSNQANRIVQVAMSVELADLAHIPANSTADVASETLLGDKFVDIKSGSSRERVKPGSQIAYKSETTTLDLQQFAESLRSVDETLRELQEGSTPLGQFVQGDQMYVTLLHRLAQIHAGMMRIENTTGEIGGLLYTDKLYRQVTTPLVELDRNLELIQSGQGSMGQLLRDPAQYEQLVAAIGDLHKSVAAFRSSPLLQSDAMYNQLNRTVASLIQTVDEMNASPLLSSSQLYDDLNGMAIELRDSLQDFHQNPKKYFRFKIF